MKLRRSRLDALIADQEHLSAVTRENIEAIQLEKLNRLLSREADRGGFYRGLPERIGSLAELSSLPFTTEEDLARHPGGLLLCSQAEVQRVLSDATSGTTGAAKRVFYTEGDLENTVQLYMAGLGELIFPGSVTMICFSFSGPFGLGELISEAITRLGATPLKLGCALSYGEYAAVMEKEKPDTFVGMPVQLLSILRACGRHSVQRALVSGDACPKSIMRGCESLLSSRLFPHYGSREMGMAGAICCSAHEGMHLRENHIIAEIVDEDGRGLPWGEWGELVITTIGMEAMPLIRYRTGDITRFFSDPCPCGSETLRLDTVKRKKSGTPMPAASFSSSLLSASDLDEILFADECIVDCRYDLLCNELSVQALTVGAVDKDAVLSRIQDVAPSLSVTLSCRSLCPDDQILYFGKRSL